VRRCRSLLSPPWFTTAFPADLAPNNLCGCASEAVLSIVGVDLWVGPVESRTAHPRQHRARAQLNRPPLLSNKPPPSFSHSLLSFLKASQIPYCRSCIRMWLLMAPTPARRVDPLSGTPLPPGAALIPDPALSARASAAKAAASAALAGMVLHIGEYLFDEDGQVLGRMPAAGGGGGGGAPPAPPGAGGGEPRELVDDPHQARPSSGMTRALALFKGRGGRRRRMVVPVGGEGEEAAGGESAGGEGAVREKA